MKKRLTILFTMLFALSLILPVSAANSRVIYDGNAKEFIFNPGSEYSPTDLFQNFKDVMPGDSLTQKITVRNNAAKNVKVKIYMRSLGAHKKSEDFLSQLELKVRKSENNKMGYMFESTADKTAQLTDWVCLGTLYSGGEVDLDVTLDVPVELDNIYKKQIGYLDWQFKIEEFPTEASDPKPPKTGDDFRIWLWVMLMISSMVLIFILIIWRRREKRVN